MILSGIFINAELDFFFFGNLNIFFDGIKMPQSRRFGLNKAPEKKRSRQFMMKEIMLLRLKQSREGPLAICAWSTTKTTFNDKASLRIGNDQITILSLMLRSFFGAHRRV